MWFSLGMEIVIALVVSSILFLLGLFIGIARERKNRRGSNIEEYEFYPFKLDDKNMLVFDLAMYMKGVRYFLKHRDAVAARQLIIIGEQNMLRDQFDRTEINQYLSLYRKYNGTEIIDDAEKYLSNYARIVTHLGESFKEIGIEILLHNLTNPARSLCTLANNVTGRKIGDGATSLVLDLKRRRLRNEDKINYELNIGARHFKCTTVPIYREKYGLIGALCVNVDTTYLLDEVAQDPSMSNAFFKEFCRTNMTIDENILSKDEYEKAQKGKRHWRDGPLNL